MSKFCQNCGAQCTDEAAFCSACGTRLAINPQQPQMPPQQPLYPNMVYVKPKIPGRGFGISSMVLGIVGLVYSFPVFSLIQSGRGIAEILFSILVFLSMPILALCFSFAARKRGYKNGISTSGLVLGAVALGIYILAFSAATNLIR